MCFDMRRHIGFTLGSAKTLNTGSSSTTPTRVLVHLDTEQAHEQLINSRLAYASVSRGRYDAQIYTNDAEKLGEELSRDASKQSELETEHEIVGRDQGHEIENAEHQSVSQSQEHGQGYGMER